MREDTSRLHAYVLCGGKGTRLWPLSRADAPKQFHKLNSDRTLFEDTLARLDYLVPDALRVVASIDHKDTIREQVRGFGLVTSDLLFEPSARNTAAAIALATQDALKAGDDPLMLIAPSDHAISTDGQFRDCVADAMSAAVDGNIVLFGVQPDRPDTKFGYIETGESQAGITKILSFREKPDRFLAERFLESGSYFWNSGVFLAKASVLAEHFKALQPEIWTGVEASQPDDPSGEIDPEIYASIPDMPFDTAIIEHAKPSVMIRAGFSWNDLGSWEALHSAPRVADDGNVISGAIANECTNSFLSGSGIQIAAHGLSDIVLVATPDIVYAAPTSEAHRLGELFEKTQSFKQKEHQTNSLRLRSWLVDQAFPFWVEHGVDWTHGGFHEHLSFNGVARTSNKRLRTMARQTWTFSEAVRHDLHPQAEDVAEHGLEFLERVARIGGGGFASVFSAQSEIVDPTLQLYDHAMVLLACSSLHDFEPTRASILAIAVINQLERNFAVCRKSGCRDAVDEHKSAQSANAHMHLLDALDAWGSKTGDGNADQLAANLRSLFNEKIYDESRGIVPEYFGKGVSDQQQNIWSPGHHFEWIHLLLNHGSSLKPEHIAIAKRLWANARSLGTTPQRRLARLELSGEGNVISGTSRSWAQCEAIRAILALKPYDLPDFNAELECAIDTLFDVHLNPAPSGTWIDEVDDRGKQISETIPASIFYHVFRSMMAVLNDKGVA